jgi:hypothetical protein
VYPSQLRTTARRRYSKSTKHLPFKWQPARSDPSVIHVAYTVNGRRGGVDRIGDMNNGPADECAFPDRNRVQLFFTSSSSPIVRAGRCSSSRMGGLFHPHPRETECRINIVHSCLGSWSWVLDPLGPVSNSPPPARCIRLLPDPKPSFALEVTWRRDLIEIHVIGHLMFGTRPLSEPSPSERRQERIIAKRR